MNHSEQPTRQNRVLPVLAAALLLCGALLFIASNYLPSLPSLMQALAVSLLIVGILLVGQYQTHFIYRIEPDVRGGEGHDLVVIQRKGRREQTVCRLGVEDVREIEEQTPDNRETIKKKYAAQKDTVHSYCVDLLPERSQYLRFDDGGDRVVIRLQASAQLIELLRAALPNEHH